MKIKIILTQGNSDLTIYVKSIFGLNEISSLKEILGFFDARALNGSKFVIVTDEDDEEYCINIDKISSIQIW